MPYWSYHKVRQRLNIRPWIIRSAIEPFIKMVQSQIRSMIDERNWASKIYRRPILTMAELEKAATQINIVPPETVEALGMDAEEIGAITWMAVRGSMASHLQRKMVQSAFQKTHPVRFFLEPTMAKAFATTELEGLTLDDLPDLPVPCSIYFPDKLVPNTGVIEHSRERWVHEIYIVKISENEEAGNTPSAYFIQKSIDAEENTSLDLLMTQLSPGAPLDDLVKGLGETFDTLRDNSLGIDPEEHGPSQIGRIIINCLLYWKSVDPDILRRINPDYDKALERVHRARGKKRERRKKDLRNTPRHEHLIVGRTLEIIQRRMEKERSLEGSTGPSNSTGRKKRWHWTRGHWKWQRYGPKNSLRKLIFIDPYWSGTLPPVEKLGYDVRS